MPQQADIRNYFNRAPLGQTERAPLGDRTNTDNPYKRKAEDSKFPSKGVENQAAGAENIAPDLRAKRARSSSSDQSHDENSNPISSSPRLLSTSSEDGLAKSNDIYTEDNPRWLDEEFDSEPKTAEEYNDPYYKDDDLRKEIEKSYELARSKMAEEETNISVEIAHDPTDAADPVDIGYLGDVEDL